MDSVTQVTPQIRNPTTDARSSTTSFLGYRPVYAGPRATVSIEINGYRVRDHQTDLNHPQNTYTCQKGLAFDILKQRVPTKLHHHSRRNTSMHHRIILALAFLVLMSSSLAAAETVVQIHPPSKAVTFNPDTPKAAQSSPRASALTGELAGAKVEAPSTFYIVPHFLVDTLDPGGDTTLLGIRNEHNTAQDVSIQYLPTDSLSSLTTQTRNLDPKEVWTINLRDALSGQAADVDGFIRGWARVLSNDPTSVDYFQATPSDAFAFGELPIDIDAGEFCEMYKVRFLIGGGFSGGTVITFMLDLPLGGNSTIDPPSVTGTVYDENGNMINNFSIWTDDFSFQLNASALVNAGTNFGSLDIRFENIDNGFSGGAASVSHDASGIFSVGLKGFCLDAPAI